MNMRRQSARLIRLLIALVMSVSAGTSSFSSVTVAASPDPGFTPVTGPPFDAPDIWVDSPINGFGTYFAGTASSSMTPVGSGDPLWPGHVNRVYARVRNFGDAPATNLTVRFYVRQPAGIGDGGAWQLIGTLNRFGPIQPRSFRDGFVEWIPVIDTPTSIKAVIDPLMGEASTTNNSVIEGSTFVAADDSALFGLREFDFLVHNPSETTGLDLVFQAMVSSPSQSQNGVPTAEATMDWQVTIDPESRHLRAGSDCIEHVMVLPPDPCMGPGSPRNISILGYYRDRGSLVPFGGVTLFGRSTKLAAIDLSCPSQAIGAGQSINLSGQLFEQDCSVAGLDFVPLRLRNQPITIEYGSPGGQVIMRSTRTDANGRFSDRLAPVHGGMWEVQALWIGDPTHSMAESPVCFFEVSGCPPPVLTSIPSPIRVTLGATQNVPLSVANVRETCNPLSFSFSISPDQGRLFVTLMDHGDGTATLRLSPVVGRDAPGRYQLTLTVADGSSPPQSASQMLTIQVCDPAGCP